MIFFLFLQDIRDFSVKILPILKEFDLCSPENKDNQNIINDLKNIEVNEKFGFYVVDIGNNTLVDQQIGNRINKINPKIEPNMKLTVARNMNSPEVKFITKGKITNVADDCSIIEVTENSNKVQVGDDIFFAKDDLK